MDDHRHVGVEERPVDEMVEPDRRAAVADQDDRLQAPCAENGVGERDPGGERGRAAVRRVDRVRGRDLGVGEADAADVGDDRELGRREPEAAQRPVERPQDERVPAALAVRARPIRR